MTDEEFRELSAEYMQLVKAEVDNARREELRQRLDTHTSAWWDSMTPEEQEEARAQAREVVLSYMRKRRQR
jgi:hypothetical protein